MDAYDDTKAMVRQIFRSRSLVKRRWEDALVHYSVGVLIIGLVALMETGMYPVYKLWEWAKEIEIWRK